MSVFNFSVTDRVVMYTLLINLMSVIILFIVILLPGNFWYLIRLRKCSE